MSLWGVFHFVDEVEILEILEKLFLLIEILLNFRVSPHDHHKFKTEQDAINCEYHIPYILKAET